MHFVDQPIFHIESLEDILIYFSYLFFIFLFCFVLFVLGGCKPRNMGIL